MTDTEQFLRERWYAGKAIGRLMMDLSLANSAYDKACSEVGVSDLTKIRERRRAKNLSPVEFSAILVVDNFRAQLESIGRRLDEERAKVRDIERAVSGARLSQREEDYLRLRYFENRSVEAVAQRLFCSLATCGRLRESALFKIENAGRHEAIS
jgi:hypothetical protein